MIIGRIRDTIVIGLEEENIKRLKEDKPIFKDLGVVHVPLNIVIFYGKTMEDLKATIVENIGPDTVVTEEERKN